MQFTASQIAAMLGGRVDGNQDAAVSSLSKIEEGKPGTLTFLANPKYTDYIYSTAATIAIVAEDFIAERGLPESLTLDSSERCLWKFCKTAWRHTTNFVNQNRAFIRNLLWPLQRKGG
jgi:UDP-3-O-[3-hydroxymyristoyl] glucosamine N-acyltransferase